MKTKTTEKLVGKMIQLEIVLKDGYNISYETLSNTLFDRLGVVESIKDITGQPVTPSQISQIEGLKQDANSLRKMGATPYTVKSIQYRNSIIEQTLEILRQSPPVIQAKEIRDEMDSDMEESGMAQGEIESCLTHWGNKYLIIRKP